MGTLVSRVIHGIYELPFNYYVVAGCRRFWIPVLSEKLLPKKDEKKTIKHDKARFPRYNQIRYAY